MLKIDGKMQKTFEEYLAQKQSGRIRHQLKVIEKSNSKAQKKINILITDHAYLRAKERLNFDRRAFERMASKAYEFGILHENFDGYIRDFLDVKYSGGKANEKAKVYGSVVYLFVKNKLITVIPLPRKETKFINKMYNREDSHYDYRAKAQSKPEYCRLLN